MLRIIGALIIVTILGCNDNDPAVINDQNEIAGVYFGGFVIDGGGSTNIYALISDDNNIRLMFFGLAGQATGQLNAIEDSYGGSLAVYQNHYENVFHAKSTDIQIDANGTDVGINGTWNNSSASGWMFFDKLSDEGQIVIPIQLSSNWELKMANSSGGIFTLAISVDSQGLITGSDTTGCTYFGSVVDLNKMGRVIPFNLNLTTCGVKDGDYDGLMAVISVGMSDKLVMLASNGAYTFSVELNR